MLPFLLDGLNDDLDAASEIMSAGTGISLTCGLELMELDPCGDRPIFCHPTSQWEHKEWARIVAPLLAEPHIHQYKLEMITMFAKAMPAEKLTKFNINRIIKFCGVLDTLFQ